MARAQQAARPEDMLTTPAELARSALDAAPDAIIIIDASGIVHYANRQVSALFGYSHDEVIGQTVEQLMPERFRSRHVGHREGYTNNVRVRPMGAGLELFGRRQDGAEFPIEISLSPIQDGERILVAAAIRDVTDRKRVEAELMVTRQVAEHEREVADRANSAKSRFLATASHDLRQPLQTLALLNGTLRRIIGDTEALQAISQQEQAIGSMSRLLNALLDISKLESGTIKPEFSEFRVATLFDELQREFTGAAQEKGLQLQVESTSSIIRSDPSLVEQVLRNLVSNAIKYTRHGSIQVRCVNEDALVRIEIVDTGIGIPATQIPYIFEEFYQVGVPTHSMREGYGLGLNIVQRVVRLLDLQLNVSSEVEKGSVFTLSLPSGLERNYIEATEAECVPEVPAPLAAQEHILLVEDDPAVRDATRMLLRVEGYRVTAVSTIAEALRKTETENIDLLITDYHLEGDEVGTALILAVREKVGSALKAVLVTGDTSSAVKELPSDPYLRVASKPIKADTLLTLLRSFPDG
jgi:two-component system, sensor histidine kinase